MLFDLPHLRAEFWRATINDDHHPPLATLSSQELIRCILEHEYPGESSSQLNGDLEVARRRPQ
jgi:hypothetical protein